MEKLLIEPKRALVIEREPELAVTIMEFLQTDLFYVDWVRNFQKASEILYSKNYSCFIVEVENSEECKEFLNNLYPITENKSVKIIFTALDFKKINLNEISRFNNAEIKQKPFVWEF